MLASPSWMLSASCANPEQSQNHLSRDMMSVTIDGHVMIRERSMGDEMWEALEDLSTRIAPREPEIHAKRDRRKAVQDCLRENLDLKAFFLSGSFGHGTAVSGYSDVDYFADLRFTSIPINSNTMLTNVRDTIDGEFPDIGVRIDPPAVIVPFGKKSNEAIEVIPAIFQERDHMGFKSYQIADGKGRWIWSSPDRYKHMLAVLDTYWDNDVKPLVRLIKAWKYYRQVEISSFYLEMRAMKTILNFSPPQPIMATTESPYFMAYPGMIVLMFENLLKCRLRAVKDPQQLTSMVSACNSADKRDRALAEVELSLREAKEATAAESQGRTDDAYYWWNRFFSRRFAPNHVRDRHEALDGSAWDSTWPQWFRGIVEDATELAVTCFLEYPEVKRIQESVIDKLSKLREHGADHEFLVTAFNDLMHQIDGGIRPPQ